MAKLYSIIVPNYCDILSFYFYRELRVSMNGLGHHVVEDHSWKLAVSEVSCPMMDLGVPHRELLQLHEDIYEAISLPRHRPRPSF